MILSLDIFVKPYREVSQIGRLNFNLKITPHFNLMLPELASKVKG